MGTRWFCLIALCLIVVAWPLPSAAAPLGTAITYQGQLKQGGVPYSGTADVQLTLFDALSGGAVVAGPVALTNVNVVNGLFTVQVDFGSAAFTGNARWMLIEVRTPSGAGSYTALSPRQALTATAYGLFALDAGRLDGLDSTAFLQSVPNPLTLTGTSATHIIRGENTAAVSGASGVKGLTSAGSGTTYGGRFESASTTGCGVYGLATAATGPAYGGQFFSNSVSGVGVLGYATFNTGNNIGGQFYSNSESGTGVLGLTQANIGTTYGGRFKCFSPAGFGGLFENSSAPAGLTVRLSGPNGAINTDGFLHRDYTATTRSCAIPIAYGSISAAGAINGGTGNFTVTHVPGSGQYDIVVDGETYSDNATVTITPVTSSPRITGVADAGTGFRVSMWNQSFVLVDNAFQFTIWASDPAGPG